MSAAADSLELRSAATSAPLPVERLAPYLAQHGMQLDVAAMPRQFAGGLANLNYLIVVDGAPAVLRRPPPGPLPPGAYDMGREFRILSRLHAGFPLAPRGLHHCGDDTIIGAPFQIVEYRRGIAVRGAIPESIRAMPNIETRLAHTLVDVLAQLHAVDPQTVGLGDLGRPEGFIERTIEGWSKRARLSAEGREHSPCHSLIEELSAWLREHRAPDGKASLIHNDLKLDNLLLDASSLRPVALLDWDQCTRGDNLFDLATTLSYYSEPGDPPVMLELGQMPTAAPGFPTRQDIAEQYARVTGRSLEHFQFHRVLAIFKLAVIFQQLHMRHRLGATTDTRYAKFGSLTDGILDFARTVARGERF